VSRVLIVEDHPPSAEWLRLLLETRGADVKVAHDGHTAEGSCEAWAPDLALLDLGLPDVDGLSLLYRLRASRPAMHVIIVTGCATVSLAVDALSAGATTLLQKPVDVDQLLTALDRVEREQLTLAVVEEKPAAQLGGLLTGDAAMQALFDTIRTTASTDVNVLIQGENGTGKELVAAALHGLGARAAGPFIRVNCAAIVPDLLESELFGHVRGAFTDAVTDKKGLFELAHRGSILLDEIGEMPLPLQVKLLRVLQEREFRPLGSTRSIKTDFRLICATNVDPQRAMSTGHLRADLYYRLNTMVLTVPPLRARPGDVRLLAAYFLRHFAGAYGRPLRGFDAAALGVLERYGWPGNVRELEHVIERAVILSRDEQVHLSDLPHTLQPTRTRRAEFALPAGCTLEEAERLAIVHTLELTAGNKRAAARILGIHRPTLYHKLHKYRLWPPENRFSRGARGENERPR
jgi:two-component system, NtrC family, response regulator HydG